VSRVPEPHDPSSHTVAQTGQPNHYSYQFYADPHTAAGFDAWRFSGPIGTLLLEEQERVIESFLGEVAGLSLIDVGTGTGRAALALARRGARVTGMDASIEMLKVAQRRAEEAGLQIVFTPGDAHALEFADGSFDMAVCLRVLMHAPDWKRCLAELCRVADRRIVFDYPALFSLAALQAAERRVAHAAGRRVEAYRVLSARAVARELGRNGFRIVAVHRQFVLPIACHKMIGSPRVTRLVERALARIGLLRLAGSPVTVVAERCAS
jgi:SAM-dependent methyltransferase